MDLFLSVSTDAGQFGTAFVADGQTDDQVIQQALKTLVRDHGAPPGATASLSRNLDPEPPVGPRSRIMARWSVELLAGPERQPTWVESARDRLYPECEALREASNDSHKLGQFLDWITGGPGPFALCEADSRITQVIQPLSAEERQRSREKLDGYLSDTPRRGVNADLLNVMSTMMDRVVDVGECYWPTFKKIEEILALYYGIDTKKVEEERRHMLDHMRELNDARK